MQHPDFEEVSVRHRAMRERRDNRLLLLAIVIGFAFLAVLAMVVIAFR